jgi:ankyrin repeat protein
MSAARIPWWKPRAGNSDLVRLLVERGADPNVRDGLGDTALAVATAKGHDGIAALLRERGARR